MHLSPTEITRCTYDKIAADYVKRKERSRIWSLANYVVVRRFVNKLPKDSNGGVLVVGPAGGHTAIAIAKRLGARLVRGVDFSKGMVREAQKLKKKSGVSNCSFEVGDITEVEIVENYDGILCDGVLYHIPKEKLPALLMKLHDCLSSHGVLYANFKTGEGFELQENPITFTGSPRAYWFYSATELEQVFKEAGFRPKVKKLKIPLFGEHFIQVFAVKNNSPSS